MAGVSEGWIVAGEIDGAPGLAPFTDVAGVPHIQRLAMELAMAGAREIFVVWQGSQPAPDLAAIAAVPVLASRARLTVVTDAPRGGDHDGILLARADRLFHRDVPRDLARAWASASARGLAGQPLALIDGPSFDGVVACARESARAWVVAAAAPGAWAARLAEVGASAPIVRVAVPYLGFCRPLRTMAELPAAERELVWSLRKSADGIASKHVNRHLSLRLTWLLKRTGVTPNHITVCAFLSALAGAVILAQPGWAAGVIGMGLVNWGSIIDGTDGELARLKYLFSSLGQWLDTLADDFGNVAYVSALTYHLHQAGVDWAAPLGIAALIAFALTQASQYWLITKVYGSGDLAAIPWAFQSSDFLSQQPEGVWAWIKATAPKMLKRDFAVTMFLGFAILDRLEWILVVFSTGALVFFTVFFVQFARNAGAVRQARAALAAKRVSSTAQAE